MTSKVSRTTTLAAALVGSIIAALILSRHTCHHLGSTATLNALSHSVGQLLPKPTAHSLASAVSGELFTGHATRQHPSHRLTFHRGATRSTIPDSKQGEVRRVNNAFTTAFPSRCTSTKWGVVTTVFEPTKSIEKVAALSGWCLVIVGDRKTPHKLYEEMAAKNNRVEYLSAKLQHRMAADKSLLAVGDFVKSLPWSHFARKNVGYLFAIAHGAELVFDFDDDNELKLPHPLPCPDGSGDCDSLVGYSPPDADLLSDLMSAAAGGAVAANTSSSPGSTESESAAGGLPVFNPYPLMGASIPSSWPRGFPMQEIKSAKAGWGLNLNVKDGDIPSAAISLDRIGTIQLLADRDPDVDGVFRLTQSEPCGSHHFSFRAPAESGSTQPSLVLPPGVYAPTNAQATLYTYNALWATLLPMTVHPRVSDIWRGFFAERSYADLGLSVVFAAPRVDQFRNPHNYLADMSAEQDLYFKSGALVDFLSSWEWAEEGAVVGEMKSFELLPRRLEQLAVALYEREYFELNDVALLQNWLKALLALGYRFPSPLPSKTAEAFSKPVPALSKRSIGVGAYCNSASGPGKSPPTPLQSESPMRESLETTTATTRKASPDSPACSTAIPRLPNVLYVVVFNNLYLSNVPKVKKLYSESGSKSVDIVFCSSSKVSNDPFFIHAPLMDEGKLSYQCTILAMQLFPDRSGYLTFGDDVLLSPGRLATLNASTMWLEGGDVSFQFSTSRPKEQGGEWALWSRLKPMGYLASAKVESDPELAPEYVKQLKTMGWMHTAADVFFFPKHVRNDFLSLAPVLLRSQVYFSNAVPTMMHLISTKTGVGITPLIGSPVWNQADRTNFTRYLPKKPHDYFHPPKLSKLNLADTTTMDRICRFLHGVDLRSEEEVQADDQNETRWTLAAKSMKAANDKVQAYIQRTSGPP